MTVPSKTSLEVHDPLSLLTIGSLHTSLVKYEWAWKIMPKISLWCSVFEMPSHY